MEKTIRFDHRMFFEIKKQVILIDVPHCKKIQICSKGFLKKFHKLTDDLHEIMKKRITKR